jgi:hypothetical protein
VRVLLALFSIGMQSVRYYATSTDESVSIAEYGDAQVRPFIYALIVSTIVILTAGRIYYRRLLAVEREKAECLILSAVILNSAGAVYVNANTDTLPSCIIDHEYIGLAKFDEHSVAFLRMMRTSFDFSHMHEHLATMRLSQKLASPMAHTLSSPSSSSTHMRSKSAFAEERSVLQLFEKFVAAAEELSVQVNGKQRRDMRTSEGGGAAIYACACCF